MEEIESLFTTFKTAVYNKDLKAFMSIYDDGVQVFDMWDRWSYDGQAAWRAMVTGWFSSLGSEKDVVTFDEISIRYSADLAVATAYVRFAAVTATGDEIRHLQNRLTWIIRQKGRDWKIIHQHTSVPVDPGTLKAILRRE